MKRKFLVFRKTEGGSADGGPLENTDENLGGAGNAETSGANEQANAARGNAYQDEGRMKKGQQPSSDKLSNGNPAPDYYRKAHSKGEKKQS